LLRLLFVASFVGADIVDDLVLELIVRGEASEVERLVLAFLCVSFSPDCLDVLIVYEGSARHVLRLNFVVDLGVKGVRVRLVGLLWRPWDAMVKGPVDLAQLDWVALVEADVAVAD